MYNHSAGLDGIWRGPTVDNLSVITGDRFAGVTDPTKGVRRGISSLGCRFE